MLDLRVATINVSGGMKTFDEVEHDSPEAQKEALGLLIKQLDATVLCLQEVTQHIDADGVTHSFTGEVNKAGGYDYSYFGKTVSMEEHMQVKQDVMVKGIFNDWWNWSKGNSIHARIPFSRLGDPGRPGVPRNIPLYQPQSYEGSRDTESRFALLSRLKTSPHPFVITLHLTTLVGEHNDKVRKNIIKKSHLLRHQQIQQLLDLVKAHILEKDEPLILTGDFNAPQDEFCIARLLEEENSFVRLKPENNGRTHPNVGKAIDHVFFYPKERLVDYGCKIQDSDLSRRASDHLPVVADLQIK
ncbi:MAG: endonuclease/exonuclease/phosphatase family protein [Chloroflexota bacterium]|jgi:endonuclease/exonuclease/phosphatase family metal-dependent hydrolase|nr:endonuclease/exonuclease/phosphatase family protein [Chloroflexota bacterium]